MEALEQILVQHKPMEWEKTHLPFETPEYTPKSPSKLPFEKDFEGDFYKQIPMYMGGSNFIFPKGGHPNTVIIPLTPLPGGGDLHSTVRYDRYHNEYDGHTTVQYKGERIRINNDKWGY